MASPASSSSSCRLVLSQIILPPVPFLTAFFGFRTLESSLPYFPAPIVMDWPAGLLVPTSQLVRWLFLLGHSKYNVHGLGGLTLDQVVKIVCFSAAAQDWSFILESLDSWVMECPLGPIFTVAALTSPHPFNATFCFCYVWTWHTQPLGDALCEYPHWRPNQVKCHLCLESHHLCIPVCVFSFFLWW